MKARISPIVVFGSIIGTAICLLLNANDPSELFDYLAELPDLKITPKTTATATKAHATESTKVIVATPVAVPEVKVEDEYQNSLERLAKNSAKRKESHDAKLAAAIAEYQARRAEIEAAAAALKEAEYHLNLEMTPPETDEIPTDETITPTTPSCN
ncbi:hypothetical protein IKF57_01160 [Candidatus Saccharibacteria bacterium]|nr:hypothetical protein [Candidatus Saccharibacteria bacterium]